MWWEQQIRELVGNHIQAVGNPDQTQWNHNKDLCNQYTLIQLFNILVKWYRKHLWWTVSCFIIQGTTFYFFIFEKSTCIFMASVPFELTKRRYFPINKYHSGIDGPCFSLMYTVHWFTSSNRWFAHSFLMLFVCLPEDIQNLTSSKPYFHPSTWHSQPIFSPLRSGDLHGAL